MLAVRVLGCSGSYAAVDNACSGYLVTTDATTVWLDAGPGTLANLQRTTTLAQLDAIVLTHAHPDHWLELPVVATALEWFEPRDRLAVYSNAHTFGEARELIGSSLAQVFDWRVVADQSVTDIGDQRWTFAATEHYVPTLATRIDADGRALAFTSDTGPGFSLNAFRTDRQASRLDLALVESTMLDRGTNAQALHLSASEAAEMANVASCRRLLLTHIAPPEDPQSHLEVAAAIFDGPTSVAEVGALYAAASD